MQVQIELWVRDFQSSSIIVTLILAPIVTSDRPRIKSSQTDAETAVEIARKVSVQAKQPRDLREGRTCPMEVLFW